jgi:hypothetical protein
MGAKRQQSSLETFVLEQLQDPLRIRFVFCAVILIGWYFGHHSRATASIQQFQGRTEAEQKRIATARQIDQLRGVLAPFQGRIPEREGPIEMIHYIMSHVRRTPVKLIDISPSRTTTIGTLRVIELQLVLEGTYADLDGLLRWVENERRLLRVDSLKIGRKSEQRAGLSIQLLLTGLVDATQPLKPIRGDVDKKGAITKQ